MRCSGPTRRPSCAAASVLPPSRRGLTAAIWSAAGGPYSSGSFAADWAILGMGRAVPEGGDPRARVRNDTGVIAELVKEALDLLMSANGASSYADANVLSRIWRDSEIAARHSHVLSGIGKEVYGRLLLRTEGPLPHDV